MAYIKDEKIIKALGNQVRKIRESKGMTMEELAYRSGLAYSQVSRIERGKINTSISHIGILAKALEVKVKELVDF